MVDGSESGTYLPKDISRVKTEQSEIKALSPGSGEKADVEAYVNNEREVIASFEKALTAAMAGRASDMKSALRSSDKPAEALLAAATRLGWSDCTKQSG